MADRCSVLYLFLQLIDMTTGELQWLSTHLGHDVTTHKSNYRLHANAVEITKVGKLLLAVDSGSLSYLGKRMNAVLDPTQSDVEPDQQSVSDECGSL